MVEPPFRARDPRRRVGVSRCFEDRLFGCNYRSSRYSDNALQEDKKVDL